MRSRSWIVLRSLSLPLGLAVVVSLGACSEIKTSTASSSNTPTRANADQEAEKDRDSLPPKTVQARPSGSPLQQCLVNFDDERALEHIYSQARTTLAFKTGRIGFGPLQMCDSSKHSDCWAYRQRCAKNDVNVDTIGSSHFHLSMETGIECYTLPDPGDGLGRGFGKLVEFKCTDVDWAKTPRILSSHDQNQWIKISVTQAESHIPSYFDFDSITVLPDKSIQLWFRKRDGTWWYYPEITAGSTTNFKDQLRDVSEVRIRGAKGGRASSYIIGSFTIRD